MILKGKISKKYEKHKLKIKKGGIL